MCKLYFFVCVVLVSLMGCSTPKSAGEMMLSQSAEVQSMGKDWNKGSELIAKGQHLAQKGNAKIKQGNKLASKGSHMTKKGHTLAAKGNHMIEQGNAMVLKGQMMVSQSESNFQRKFLNTAAHQEISDDSTVETAMVMDEVNVL
jgi:hypothetical protein